MLAVDLEVAVCLAVSVAAVAITTGIGANCGPLQPMAAVQREATPRTQQTLKTALSKVWVVMIMPIRRPGPRIRL
jgi:hypothetical protein